MKNLTDEESSGLEDGSYEYLDFNDDYALKVSTKHKGEPLVSIYVSELTPCNNVDQFKVQSELKRRRTASFKLEQADYTRTCDNSDSRYFQIIDAPPITEKELFEQNMYNKTHTIMDILNKKTEGNYYNTSNKYFKRAEDTTPDEQISIPLKLFARNNMKWEGVCLDVNLTRDDLFKVFELS